MATRKPLEQRFWEKVIYSGGQTMEGEQEAVLDLLIINPGAAHGIYGELGNDLVAVEPPMWCRLIAGYVRDRGYSVQIIDAEAERFSPYQVATLAYQHNPRIACIAVYGHQPSASTQQMVGAGAIAREIKKLVVSIPIIMVGGHVAALPERTLAEEAIDYACNGEGPVTIVELLKQTAGIGDFKEVIPGLVHWGPDGAAFNSPSAPLIPIDELHGDAWDLLPMTLYRAHNWQCFGDLGKRQPYASVMTSLGCPYKCSFCCINAPFGTNRYRMRKPADVVAEIAMLYRDYGVRTFKIVDEMFVLNPKHYLAICDGLIEAELGPELNIWAYARIDTVQPATLEKLRAAGFRWLALGIESGSKHVRDGSDKALKNDDIAGVVRAIQVSGINVIGNFIFGLPDDGFRSMQETLDLALSLNCEFANFYSAMAYPGSALYDKALADRAALPQSWSGYSQHNADCRPLDTEHVGARDVLAFRDAAFTRYFTDPAYLGMIYDKFGAATLEHVTEMTKFKLPRKLLTGEIS